MQEARLPDHGPAPPVDVYQDALVQLDPPPRMDEWRLPLIVQLVNFRSRNGTIPAVPAHALQQGDWETVTEFLDRLVELLLHEPFQDHAQYAIYLDRTNDIQAIIRNMFPATCIPPEIRRAMAQNLAFGVTFWRWTNELMIHLVPALGAFAFHVERDAQRSLVHRLDYLIREWDVAQEKFDGRDIYLAGHTITPRALCFQDLVPNISGAEHYLQDLARKFGEGVASDDGDDSDGDGDGDSDGGGKRKRPRPLQ